MVNKQPDRWWIRDESSKVSSHPMFNKLGEIKDAFPARAVEQYIEVMRGYRGQITKADLLDRTNLMGDNLDPVFVALARVMYGSEVVDADVYARMRGEWCNDDLPPGYDYVAYLPDDKVFSHTFDRFRFDPRKNIKLLALQRRGIGDLIEEKRRWQASRR